MRRVLLELAKFLAYGLLGVVLVVVLVRSSGHRVALNHVPRNLTQPTAILQFDAKGEIEPFELFPEDSPVRNVILLVGDGLGFAQVIAARSEFAGVSGRLAFERMPITGWLTTHSLTSLGTDSAASATAMATGSKTRSGRLGVDRSGEPLRTLVEAAHEAGMWSGLVTDSYLWDATTAAFVVHVESRREDEEILRQMAVSGTRVMLGGIDSNMELDDPAVEDIVQPFREAGYRIALGPESLEEAAASEEPLLGLSKPRHISRRDRQPSLKGLTEIALGRLEASEQGFFLLVETEETDTAGHYNDFQRMVVGVRALERAAEVAIDFARKNGETLVLLTADHDTGGLLIYHGSPGDLLRVGWATDGHLATPVPLYAFGPGAQNFSGVHDNTDLAPILARLLGLDL